MIKEIFTTVILLTTITLYLFIEININIKRVEDKNLYNRYVDIKSTNDLINVYSNLLK